MAKIEVDKFPRCPDCGAKTYSRPYNRHGWFYMACGRRWHHERGWTRNSITCVKNQNAALRWERHLLARLAVDAPQMPSCPTCGGVYIFGMPHDCRAGLTRQLKQQTTRAKTAEAKVAAFEAKNARMQVIMAGLPTPAAITKAIARIQESVMTHEQWRDYRLEGNTTDSPEAGDLDHHTKALGGYAEVQDVLRSTREAAQAAAEGK